MHGRNLHKKWASNMPTNRLLLFFFGPTFLFNFFLNSELKKKRNSEKDFKKIKEKMSDWILVLIKKLLAENFKAARVDPYN